MYERALNTEGSYGKVAKKFGVTREEVCHYVTVVKRLPPDVVQVVENEREVLRVRRFNLRALLRVARLEGRARQRSAFAALK